MPMSIIDEFGRHVTLSQQTGHFYAFYPLFTSLSAEIARLNSGIQDLISAPFSFSSVRVKIFM